MRLYGRKGEDGDYNELIEEIALTPEALNLKPDEQIFYIDMPENKSISIWLDFEEGWKPYSGIFEDYTHYEDEGLIIIENFKGGKLVFKKIMK